MNWKGLVLMMLVTLATGILGGVIGSHVIWPGKVVAAEEFRLLDHDGYALATLAIEWDQNPVLSFNTKDGEGNLLLGKISPEEMGLILFYGEAERVGLYYAEKDDYPMLRLSDANGKARVGLRLVDPEGRPLIQLLDEKGNPKAFIGSAATKGPGKGEKIVWPTSSMALSDSNGYALWIAP